MTWENAILIQRKQDIYTQLGMVTCIPIFIGFFNAFWYFFKYSIIKKDFLFFLNKRFTLE